MMGADMLKKGDEREAYDPQPDFVPANATRFNGTEVEPEISPTVGGIRSIAGGSGTIGGGRGHRWTTAAAPQSRPRGSRAHSPERDYGGRQTSSKSLAVPAPSRMNPLPAPVSHSGYGRAKSRGEILRASANRISIRPPPSPEDEGVLEGGPEDDLHLRASNRKGIPVRLPPPHQPSGGSPPRDLPLTVRRSMRGADVVEEESAERLYRENEALELEIGKAQQQLEAERAARASLEASHKELLTTAKELEALLRERTPNKHQVWNRSLLAERELVELRRQLEVYASEIDKLRAEKEAMGEEVESLCRQKAEVEKERERLADVQSRLKDELAEVARKHTEALGLADSLAEERDSFRDELRAQSADVTALAANLQLTRAKLSEMKKVEDQLKASSVNVAKTEMGKLFGTVETLCADVWRLKDEMRRRTHEMRTNFALREIQERFMRELALLHSSTSSLQRALNRSNWVLGMSSIVGGWSRNVMQSKGEFFIRRLLTKLDTYCERKGVTRKQVVKEALIRAGTGGQPINLEDPSRNQGIPSNTAGGVQTLSLPQGPPNAMANTQGILGQAVSVSPPPAAGAGAGGAFVPLNPQLLHAGAGHGLEHSFGSPQAVGLSQTPVSAAPPLMASCQPPIANVQGQGGQFGIQSPNVQAVGPNFAYAQPDLGHTAAYWPQSPAPPAALLNQPSAGGVPAMSTSGALHSPPRPAAGTISGSGRVSPAAGAGVGGFNGGGAGVF
uniref:Uncharacterized protein n=1 Tax=Chromera velia CCMP2878 TaxID=1169474 RepID=A0A0G4GFE6_9ALVE|eukprot:Cvel_4629.t1-p1 / transcript=Cvel_4629.t1 / gene=Cvel_4629 / organism=Chromera_velia_CCMP2878 / gene_product=hypothetical protein / transcript_product=hypothetical protein / location=Cvel_scaffold204:15916-25743(+) / protein_length=732 / sequence_SO=supercontig / SO=protein_coding / is_pseudo=false